MTSIFNCTLIEHMVERGGCVLLAGLRYNIYITKADGYYAIRFVKVRIRGLRTTATILDDCVST